MGNVMGYMCTSCGFDTDIANCDDCDAVLKWDGEPNQNSVHCTGCGQEITVITCRECGNKFSI